MSECEVLRARVAALTTEGRASEALALQRRIVEETARLGQPQASELHRLGVMLFQQQEFAAAAAAFHDARRLDSGLPAVDLNLGLSLIRIGRFEEARAELEAATARHPDDINLMDGLADVYGKLGEYEKAREFGERALIGKDRLAPAPRSPLRTPSPPSPIDLDRPHENVLAFSLFGDRPRYLLGALKNAMVAPALYPGWQCRFYCDDSVPARIRKQLRDAGATIALMPRPERPADALFWRFRVSEEPGVKRFLIRDCDAVINIRERHAVEAWLASGRLFHVMRDHASHTALIMAGMWGGTAGILPPLASMVEGFAYNPATESRTADQQFLGTVVWPMIKASCLIHDRLYRVFGAGPFPPGSELPGDRHVGQNEAASNGID